MWQFNVGNTFERVDSTTIIVDNSQLRGFTSVFKANALEHYWAKSLTLKRFGREIKDLCVSRGTLQKGSDVKLGIHQQVYRRWNVCCLKQNASSYTHRKWLEFIREKFASDIAKFEFTGRDWLSGYKFWIVRLLLDHCLSSIWSSQDTSVSRNT